MADWTKIYPITKTKNVIDDNGNKLNEVLMGLSTSTGLIEESVGDSTEIVGNYIIFPSGFFILSYPEIVLKIDSQPLYNRATVNLPFDVGVSDYSVSLTIQSGGGLSVGDIKNLYVRNKYTNRFDISSVNAVNASASDKIIANVTVTGVTRS